MISDSAITHCHHWHCSLRVVGRHSLLKALRWHSLRNTLGWHPLRHTLEWHAHRHRLALHHRSLLPPLQQLVDLLLLLTLLTGHLSDIAKESGQIDLVLFKSFLKHRHGVFQCQNFSLQLYELLTHSVFGSDELTNVLRVDLRLGATVRQFLLDLGVFLAHSIHDGVYVGHTAIEVGYL